MEVSKDLLVAKTHTTERQYGTTSTRLMISINLLLRSIRLERQRLFMTTISMRNMLTINSTHTTEAICSLLLPTNLMEKFTEKYQTLALLRDRQSAISSSQLTVSLSRTEIFQFTLKMVKLRSTFPRTALTSPLLLRLKPSSQNDINEVSYLTVINI